MTLGILEGYSFIQVFSYGICNLHMVVTKHTVQHSAAIHYIHLAVPFVLSSLVTLKLMNIGTSNLAHRLIITNNVLLYTDDKSPQTGKVVLKNKPYRDRLYHLNLLSLKYRRLRGDM